MNSNKHEFSIKVEGVVLITGVLIIMLVRQSLFLVVASTLLISMTGIVRANDVEVQAGNVQVSVKNDQVTVQSAPTRSISPSWLERLRNLSLNRSRTSQPSVSSRCQTSQTIQQSTRSNTSGRIHTSSSSSNTVCR